MECPRCHQKNRAEARFCEDCGAPLAVQCPSCGAALTGGKKFCGACGQSILDQAVPLASSAESARAPEAERRQITVMFCDLAGSTALSERLDPEELREVVRGYQQACADIIQRFDGHIAQYLGDGLLVYFGYPRAHEDDAQRAVRAGLGIIEAIKRPPPGQEGVPLAVRVGIHTGLVVVGEVGGGSKHEQLALGESPNLAARLQALAEPDTVVISGATQRLLHEMFVLEDLGRHAVKGISAHVPAFRVMAEIRAQSRLDVSSTTGLTPLVGREQEVGLLRDRWEQVKEGRGQIVLLEGEPGIGKSRLVRALKECLANEPHTRWECRGSPYHQDSALYPMIDLFERALQFERSDPAEERLRKLEAALQPWGLAHREALCLWAALLSVPLPTHYPLLALTPQRQKQKTFEAIVALLRALAAEQPVLVILEDLHWIDPSTLELMDLVLDQIPTAPILALLAFRPEFQPPWGPRAHLTRLTVTRFIRRQTELMAERVAGGKALPAEVLREIVAKTDGVPLFVEELTKMVLESGLLEERGDRYQLRGPLPPLAIPSTLRDSLMARLDRLAVVKDVAQLGATLGRSFSYDLLKAVSSLDEEVLSGALGRLIEAELLYQRGVRPDATYIFKHALIQEAAYQSMLISRRRQLHQRIAAVLSERFPETTQTQPEELARHYTEAGLTAQAVEYWRRAGERAIQRSANLEAIAHLTRGLEVLKTLPDTRERDEQELILRVALGTPLQISKGWAAPEAEHVHSRALELCRRVGAETPQFFWTLAWLQGFYTVRGEIRTGRELIEQGLTLAEHLQDPELLRYGHFILGDVLFWFGELVSTRAHLEQSMVLYDPERDRSAAVRYGWDTGMACQSFLGRVLWHLGYPDRAVKCSDQAIAIADNLAHPFSQSWALSWAAALHQLRREAPRAQERAEADVALATEQVIPFFGAHGMVLRGWALVEQGHREEGIAQLHQGLAAYRATGAELEQSHWLALLAEACARTGQQEEGLRVVAEALAEVEQNGIRYYEAELLRLKGELLLKRVVADEQEAEACFRRAVEIACQQQAKSFELRATTSLSRLWQRQGKHAEARRSLADVYGWFTEGFDTTDLKEAKALLENLA